MFWGLTPALDLLQEVEKYARYDGQEVNVLLVGCYDARHVLETLAKKYRHERVQINIFLVEGCMESVSRQLLLLSVALEPPEELGLVQKTRFFMEIYGNSIQRPAVAKYLHAKAQQLIRMVTDPDHMREVMPFVTLEILYKERDYVENLLKFWCGTDEFNIFEYWDRRLRKSLGVRYDTRKGVFDWDLHMRYHLIGGSQICPQEYQHFRMTGIAFGWLESEVSKPNRSMVCGIIPNGTGYLHHGYLGDMVTGPYVAYGIQCEDSEFLKGQNGQSAHRSTDVTERNLSQIFHEIQHQQEYNHTKINEMCLGSVVASLAQVKVVDIGAAGENGAKDVKRQKCIAVRDVHLTFLSLQTFTRMKHKKKYRNFFDCIYFNSSYVDKHLDCNLIKTIGKENALIVVENELFILGNRDKQIGEYGRVVREKMSALEDISGDILKDSYLRFRLI